MELSVRIERILVRKKLVYITGPRNDPSSIEHSGILPGPGKFSKAVIFREQLSPVAVVTFTILSRELYCSVHIL